MRVTKITQAEAAKRQSFINENTIKVRVYRNKNGYAYSSKTYVHVTVEEYQKPEFAKRIVPIVLPDTLSQIKKSYYA